MPPREPYLDKEMSTVERVRRHRWIKRVEKTADVLNQLLNEDHPNLKRDPDIPPELIEKLQGLVRKAPSLEQSVTHPLAKTEEGGFWLAIRTDTRISIEDCACAEDDRREGRWVSWTLNEKHGVYFRTGIRQSSLKLKLSFRSQDDVVTPVGAYYLDLEALADKGVVKKRRTEEGEVFDVRIVRDVLEIKPDADELVPGYIAAGVTALASQWKSDPERPSVDRKIKAHCEELLDAWIEDDSLPLLIRKYRSNRGHRLVHESGRVLVPVDNAPANWILSCALHDHAMELSDVMPALESGTLPVGMMADRGAVYTGQQRIKMEPPNLNTLGWKICHVNPVGIGYGEITQLDIALLKDHMRRFLSVSNMFLIPKTQAGLGELPQFTEVFSNEAA